MKELNLNKATQNVLNQVIKYNGRELLNIFQVSQLLKNVTFLLLVIVLKWPEAFPVSLGHKLIFMKPLQSPVDLLNIYLYTALTNKAPKVTLNPKTLLNRHIMKGVNYCVTTQYCYLTLIWVFSFITTQKHPKLFKGILNFGALFFNKIHVN